MDLANIWHEIGRKSVTRRRSFGSIRRLRSGRYQTRYTGPDYQTHAAPETFTSRIDAEALLATERRLCGFVKGTVTIEAGCTSRLPTSSRSDPYSEHPFVQDNADMGKLPEDEWPDLPALASFVRLTGSAPIRCEKRADPQPAPTTPVEWRGWRCA